MISIILRCSLIRGKNVNINKTHFGNGATCMGNAYRGSKYFCKSVTCDMRNLGAHYPKTCVV